MYFRHIAELDGGVAWIVDARTGQLDYISPSVETLTGFTPADVADHISGKRKDAALAVICAGVAERLKRFGEGDASRVKLVREVDQLRKDGSSVPLEVVSSIVLDDAGQPLAVVGVARDISERRERDGEQRRFASLLNHEFRTPLSTIDGAIQRLEVTGANADEPTRQRYRNIQGAVDRLIELLDEFLSPDRMAQVGRKRHANSAEPLLLLRDAAMQARALGRNATVEGGDLPASIRCEPDGLRLALKVLVENAVQYSPAGAAIVLRGGRADHGTEMLVRDHGPGIAEADLPRIFDKFYRGSNADGTAGSGLGLYMARSVVEVHGGNLSVRNCPDGGAEFRLWLPAGKNLAPRSDSSDNRKN